MDRFAVPTLTTRPIGGLGREWTRRLPVHSLHVNHLLTDWLPNFSHLWPPRPWPTRAAGPTMSTWLMIQSTTRIFSYTVYNFHWMIFDEASFWSPVGRDLDWDCVTLDLTKKLNASAHGSWPLGIASWPPVWEPGIYTVMKYLRELRNRIYEVTSLRQTDRQTDVCASVSTWKCDPPIQILSFPHCDVKFK